MSSIKTTAIVLKSIKWKDSSKIVTLYTREAGKISIIAKGIRQVKSNYGGILESINLVEVVIYFSSKRQIQILGAASLENAFSQLKRDIEKTGYTYAILELISILIPMGSADKVFFDFLKTVLEEMEGIKDPRIIFWFFMLKISSYMGFRPDLNTCASCMGDLDGMNLDFSFQKGGVICKNCGGTNIDGG
jgi:DNA repair protein RecO (recombination protein O)